MAICLESIGYLNSDIASCLLGKDLAKIVDTVIAFKIEPYLVIASHCIYFTRLGFADYTKINGPWPP